FRARCAFLSLFFDYSSADPRALHSFPTRRSSDLGETAAGAGQRQLSNHEFFVRLGRRLSAALSEVIEDGFVFRVDMALRPNGKSGPLAASLGMVEEYLIVQGREWERYAWVKARAVTGEPEDIAALDAIVRPFVFRRYLDFGVIDAIRN